MSDKTERSIYFLIISLVLGLIFWSGVLTKSLLLILSSLVIFVLTALSFYFTHPYDDRKHSSGVQQSPISLIYDFIHFLSLSHILTVFFVLFVSIIILVLGMV